MNRFYDVYRTSSPYKKEPLRQLQGVASSAACGFAVKYLFETPYAFLISYAIIADHSIDLIEKWAVKKKKIRSFSQWYLFEIAFSLLAIQAIRLTDRSLFPERRSHVVEVALVIYLIKRANVAFELNRMLKLY